MTATVTKPNKRRDVGLPPISELIEMLGEEQAKLVCREYYRNPKHIHYFAELFPDYVPTEVAAFHRVLLEDYTTLEGNIAEAAPRGHAKSTITDVVYLAWVMLYCVKHFTILLSDTYDQSTTLLEGLKTELESNDVLLWMFGDVRTRQWSSESLVINGYPEEGGRLEGKVLGKGAGNKIRGLKFKSYRPDLVLIDDLENDEAVESADRRAKLKRWLLKSVMPALDPVTGQIIMVGTLLHRDSLLSNIIDGKDQFAGWHRRKFAAIQPDGTALWPERFSLHWLIGQRDDPKHPLYLGPIAFSQEMMNNPISEEDQIIKPEWCNYRYRLAEELATFAREYPRVHPDDLLRTWLRFNFKAIRGHIDPAISEKQTADWWAMITIGLHKSGEIWLLDYVRMRESDPTVQGEEILDSFEVWGHDAITVESVAYQAGLFQLVKKMGALRRMFPPLHPWKPDRDKRRRAIMQSANFAGRLVRLREDHPLFQAFLDEMLEFPQGTHDDMFDAYMGAAEPTVLKVKRRAFAHKPAGL